ncbi:MAG: ornithine carbamoyltransferase [Alphaproteobacteria bacterium]|nr:ornithine carbamoyltransferase [Alphaproteobacteria bacterium]
MSQLRHFLDLDAIDPKALRAILDDAVRRKAQRVGRGHAEVDEDQPLRGKILAMIFEKPSTRTRVSFDVAVRQLGGETLHLSSGEMQIGRGETAADTARTLSRYVDMIMIRTTRHQVLLDLARHATVPVINGLTDRTHPCQVLADIMTFEERRGPIAGRRLAWSGDGNNVAVSLIQGAVRFRYELRLACPRELAPPADVLAWAKAEGGAVSLCHDPLEAAGGADCVMTDVWMSMNAERAGGEQMRQQRHNLLAAYQVNERVMARAKPDALFMHCLPAHRGEEVTGAVIDGPQSVVWDEAENRLHAQKGILAWCLAA